MSYLSTIFRKAKCAIAPSHRRSAEKRITGREIGETIQIVDLICPLRYDILVRAEFIRFLAQNDYLSKTHLEAILANPVTQRYRTWFKELPFRRRFPEIYNDEARLHELFVQRIAKVQSLWKSMSTQGYDHANPITLKTGERIQEVNGKSFGAKYYLGDGCHRIACLWIMGKKTLEPAEYVVRVSQTLQPRDNTTILLDKLPVLLSEYLSFISLGYGGGQALSDVDMILTYVRSHDPDRLEELKNVLKHDLNLIDHRHR